MTTTDDAVLALEDLVATWRKRLSEHPSLRELDVLRRWMEAVNDLIGEARKYDFLNDTLTAAGGRPVEFIEVHAIEIGPPR